MQRQVSSVVTTTAVYIPGQTRKASAHIDTTVTEQVDQTIGGLEIKGSIPVPIQDDVQVDAIVPSQVAWS
jgi:hypothetical protein